MSRCSERFNLGLTENEIETITRVTAEDATEEDLRLAQKVIAEIKNRNPNIEPEGLEQLNRFQWLLNVSSGLKWVAFAIVGIIGVVVMIAATK